jgi:DNA polymerase-3 subunit epsilon/ATP-dependent DNA helicase DinG
LLVGSPFDYKANALIYLPSDLPEPSTPNYQKSLEQTLIALCKATEGRALVLLTSHSAVRTTYYAIGRPLEESGISVLGHGIDGTPRQLVDRFKNAQRAVLIGTASLWEGIDVVGEALSVLVIGRLPFSVPSDPIFAARSEVFENAFSEYAVPQSVIRFKQGFGRLIRSKTDRGVVVVLDQRITSKSYGASFLKSLPACTVRKGPAADLPVAAKEWLEARAA